MENVLQLKTLQSLLEEKKKHDTGTVASILPFASKRTKVMRNNFESILGEYVRQICSLELIPLKKRESSDLFAPQNPFIEKIMEQIDYNAENQYDLERFLKSYLFTEDEEIKPVHPYLFNYVTINDKKQKNELDKYAKFAKSILVNKEEIKEIFHKKDASDILTELILNNLDNLKHQIKEDEYQSLLPTLSNFYQEDLMFLSKYKDYFLSSFPLLTHLYTFMYVCQLVLKFDQFEKADYSEVDPLYFALDWESLSKRRKATDGLEGFQKIKDAESSLFVHVHTMAQLSHNVLIENVDKSRPFMTYTDIYKIAETKDTEVVKQLCKDVNEWVKVYRSLSFLNTKEIKEYPEATTIEQGFRNLFKSLKMGMSETACIKYGQNIEDLGGATFLKNRGSLGLTLNMTHEMLILLTAVCVKTERMPLNQLFKEFSKRGINFDLHSKKEIIQLFDNHNIIDKKSDSGDAQYVKPIL